MSSINNLISILIINYNNKKFLERSINSCLTQSYKNFEILIYDDQSSENISDIEKKFSKISYINFYYNNGIKKNIPALDASAGYEFLINKSKGSLIVLLDSDDYFHDDKLKNLNNIFNKRQNISFVQNLISIKDKPNLKLKKKNFLFSYWPYLAPESCISFRRSFFDEYYEYTKNFKDEFDEIWLGFRLGVFSFFKKKNFYQLNQGLTFYENFGESLKFKTFNSKWWERRLNSFSYTKKILNKSGFIISLDYFVTKLIVMFNKKI